MTCSDMVIMAPKMITNASISLRVMGPRSELSFFHSLHQTGDNFLFRF